MNTCPKGAPPDDVTVMAAVPLCPSLVALIVMEPGLTPETRPLLLTVATAVLELDHVTVRPESGFPPASLGVPVSCTVWPACTEAEGGVTSTDATGTFVTLIDEVPLFPSLVAVIVAEPGVTPETRPLLLTVATAVLELDRLPRLHRGRGGRHLDRRHGDVRHADRRGPALPLTRRRDRGRPRRDPRDEPAVADRRVPCVTPRPRHRSTRERVPASIPRR